MLQNIKEIAGKKVKQSWNRNTRRYSPAGPSGNHSLGKSENKMNKSVAKPVAAFHYKEKEA